MDCIFCKKPNSNYTCPKCNVKYCSTKCYNDPAHVECTEKFYKEQVLLEMKADDFNNASRKKMLEILKRTSNPQSEEDPAELNEFKDDDINFSWLERFKDLDLDAMDENELWDKLSDEEKQQFSILLRDKSRIADVLQVWQPWWICSSDRDENSKLVKHPMVITDPLLLPKLLEGCKLSITLPFNLLEILCSYVIICRSYNGDIQDFSMEATRKIFKISGNLKRNETYENSLMAIESCLSAAEKVKLLLPKSQMIEDVIQIIQGPHKDFTSVFIEAALSDLYRLFSSAKKSKHLDGETRQLFGKGQKKLLFLLSWSKEHGHILFENIPKLQDLK